MKIKRTVAADMRAAMQIIRDTHGPEAVILSKRNVAGGIEVVSAIDVEAEDAPMLAESRPARRTEPSRKRGTVAELEQEISAATSAEQEDASRTVVRAAQLLESAKAARRALTGTRTAPAATSETAAPAESADDTFTAQLARAQAASSGPATRAPAADSPAVTPDVITEPRRTARSETEHRPAAPEQAAVRQAEAPRPVAAPLQATASADTAEINAELKRMRQLMAQQLAIMGWQARVERSPASVALLRDLYALGFDTALSQRVCEAVSLQADPDTNWQLARHWLAARLPIADCNPLTDSGVSAVFGASGAGKTSTVVKLAARFALAHGPESVVLVSTDTERVGGTATLHAFASVLGVPVHSVNALDELRPLLDVLRQQYARVLIDTGNGERNRALALELADIAENADSPLQNYIVLPANAAPGDSLALLGALGRTLPVATVLTKVDEATDLGSVLSTVIEQQLPIAAVSAGARVPDDIDVVETETLIEWCERAPAAREAASSLSESALVARFGATR